MVVCLVTKTPAGKPGLLARLFFCMFVKLRPHTEGDIGLGTPLKDPQSLSP